MLVFCAQNNNACLTLGVTSPLSCDTPSVHSCNFFRTVIDGPLAICLLCYRANCKRAQKHVSEKTNRSAEKTTRIGDYNQIVRLPDVTSQHNAPCQQNTILIQRHPKQQQQHITRMSNNPKAPSPSVLFILTNIDCMKNGTQKPTG